MILLDVAKQLNEILDEIIVYGRKIEGIWRPNSPVQLVQVPEYSEGDPEAPEGMSYVLEIFLCKEVVEAYSNQSGKKEPSDLEKAEAIAYYAQYDTYLPVSRQ